MELRGAVGQTPPGPINTHFNHNGYQRGSSPRGGGGHKRARSGSSSNGSGRGSPASDVSMRGGGTVDLADSSQFVEVDLSMSAKLTVALRLVAAAAGAGVAAGTAGAVAASAGAGGTADAVALEPPEPPATAAPASTVLEHNEASRWVKGLDYHRFDGSSKVNGGECSATTCYDFHLLPVSPYASRSCSDAPNTLNSCLPQSRTVSRCPPMYTPSKITPQPPSPRPRSGWTQSNSSQSRAVPS